MRGGFRLGKLFGIDLAVDWSWVFVFAMMAWNLTVVFRAWHPAWPLVGCLALAIVAGLLFFGSLLLHELAHSVVAQRFGMKVTEIRLFLFGGVSKLEKEPPSPGVEAWMALAGPLLSIALSAACFFTFALLARGAAVLDPNVGPPAKITETLASLGPIQTLLFWLGPVNLMVAVFNLIPGFPLDGGRVFRAVLWKLSGDLHHATRVAASVGRGIGWTFVVLGVAMLFGVKVPFFGGGPGGLWLVFVGWFLATAAERSFAALLLQEALEGVRVRQLMRPAKTMVPADLSVRSLVEEWFLHSEEQACPVVASGAFVGLVTVSDLRKLSQETWARHRVSEIMTPLERLVVVRPFDEARDALRKLGEGGVDQLPVVDESGLVGMFTRSDLGRWIELHVGSSRPRLSHVG